MNNIIVLVTVAISFWAFKNESFFQKGLFSPYLIRSNKEWHRVISHAFIHADWAHLFMNMYVLYSFGNIVEEAYFAIIFPQSPSLYYLLLYVGGIIMSSLPSFEKHKNNSYYSAVGASGAVSAVVFSSIVINPLSGIGIIFFPGLNIPAWLFGAMYLWYSWYMAKRGNSNIGHDAHFWGAVFGIIFMIVLKPSLINSFFAQILGGIG